MKLYLLQENDYDVYSAWGIYSSIDKVKEALWKKHKKVSNVQDILSYSDLVISFTEEINVQGDIFHVNYSYKVVEYTLDEAL